MFDRSQALIVFSTAPDSESADSLARVLVEEQLAACVHVMPVGHSYYVWEGKMNRDQELGLIIKTHADQYKALQARLLVLHPYDVPEILAIPVSHGLPAYLNWLFESVKSS
ncbi:MAG: divalent-cation tolerance protein CutA [Magnetococcales bacterium]|nr:divalent-cation tolerance protein CutA [Magnetococcales bacterium]